VHCVAGDRLDFVLFTSISYKLDGSVARIGVAGQVRGAAATRMQLTILEVIIVEFPGELVIDLHAATGLSNTGVDALVTGDTLAIEYGSLYRIINAQHHVRHALQATGVHDVLRDSDDIGALVLALGSR
jgi:anti-anti-sigma regulatory factor